MSYFQAWPFLPAAGAGLCVALLLSLGSIKTLNSCKRNIDRYDETENCIQMITAALLACVILASFVAVTAGLMFLPYVIYSVFVALVIALVLVIIRYICLFLVFGITLLLLLAAAVSQPPLQQVRRHTARRLGSEH